MFGDSSMLSDRPRLSSPARGSVAWLTISVELDAVPLPVSSKVSRTLVPVSPSTYETRSDEELGRLSCSNTCRNAPTAACREGCPCSPPVLTLLPRNSHEPLLKASPL